MSSSAPFFNNGHKADQSPLYTADIFPDLHVASAPNSRKADTGAIQSINSRLNTEKDPYKQGELIAQALAVSMGKELFPKAIPGAINYQRYFAQIICNQIFGIKESVKSPTSWNPLESFYSALGSKGSSGSEVVNYPDSVMDPSGRYEIKVSGIIFDAGRYSIIGSIYDKKEECFIFPDTSSPPVNGELKPVATSKNDFIGLHLDTFNFQQIGNGWKIDIGQQIGVVLTPALEERFMDELIKDVTPNPIYSSIVHAVKMLTGEDVGLSKPIISSYDPEKGLQEIRLTTSGKRIAWGFTRRNSPIAKVEIFGIEAEDQDKVVTSYNLDLEQDPITRLTESYQDRGLQLIPLENSALERIEGLIAEGKLKISSPSWMHVMKKIDNLAAKSAFLAIDSQDPENPTYRLHFVIAASSSEGARGQILMELIHPTPPRAQGLFYDKNKSVDELFNAAIGDLPGRISLGNFALAPEALQIELENLLAGNFSTFMGQTVESLVNYYAQADNKHAEMCKVNKVTICHPQSTNRFNIEDIRLLVEHSLGTSVFVIYRSGANYSGWIESSKIGVDIFTMKTRAGLSFSEDDLEQAI